MASLKSAESQYQEQLDTFERFYRRLDALLEKHGKPDSLLESGDFSIYADYGGTPQIKISIHSLSLLLPAIVKQMQTAMDEFPRWSVVLTIALREHYHDWPEMGLIVRRHEIVDGLQRQYFPKEFQSIEYAGSRRGTDRD